MTTLEKIRNRSVLLIVVIGIALLAFIIGDFLNSGRSVFGPGTTVAKVDGKKIDVIEFQNRLQQQSAMLQNQNRKVDAAQLEQQVLDAMVSEALFDAEAERLGLTVTDAELSDIMLGRGAAVMSGRIAQESQGQIQSTTDLYNMIRRPADYGISAEQANQLRAYWKQLEEQVSQEIIQQKFMNLFGGTLVANKLDAKAFYDENAAPSRIAYVKKEIASVPSDESNEPTEDEINQEWAKSKNAYKIDGELRSVNYLSVAIVPSAEDLMAGQKRVEQARMKLREADNMAAVGNLEGFDIDNRHSVASAVRDRSLKAFLDTAAVGAADIIMAGSNAYTLVKLLGKTTDVDSVNINMLAVQGKEQFDSVFNALKGGAKFADMASNPAVVSSTDSTWVSLQNPNMGQLRQALADRPVGVYFTPDTTANANGGVIYRINTRRPAVTVYDYAYVTYTVEPSEATVSKLESDLSQFLADNNNSTEFVAKAIEAGYQTLPANVSASTPRLGNLDDSRGAIIWALDAKKGEVSPIFGNEQTGRFIAVAVNDIYSDYIPARDPRVHDYLSMRVRNQKKAEALKAEYAGKASDLAGYASAMQSRVDSISVGFGQQMVGAFGVEAGELQAQVAVAAPGKLVGPVATNNAVVVFSVVGNEEPTRPYDFNEVSGTFNNSRGAYRLAASLQQILLGDKEVTNNLPTFFHHEN